ncbi:Uma2 family endonuclease [Streptosporangium sp. NBC_01755]|uniref:Uma2 family endonuclease n=2 Tax=unclassified Streptosporangium TaxID=2632669 RepID=UPI002DDA35AD|nr:Uma2 family endonuclease [Streptosporangium sp. NBC_01755]
MGMELRRRHADLRPSPETASRPLPHTPRELFDALPSLPGLRAEVIGGRLVVSPLGTPEYARAAMLLSLRLHPLITDGDLEAYTSNVAVCVDGSYDPVVPDFVLARVDCPRWGDRELLSSGLLMVAEIVSPGSVTDDRDRKPDIYASGGVPVMLLIDPVATPATVTVLSDPKEGAYRTSTRVEMGSHLHIPEPVDFTLDTSIFATAQGTVSTTPS